MVPPSPERDFSVAPLPYELPPPLSVPPVLGGLVAQVVVERIAHVPRLPAHVDHLNVGIRWHGGEVHVSVEYGRPHLTVDFLMIVLRCCERSDKQGGLAFSYRTVLGGERWRVKRVAYGSEYARLALTAFAIRFAHHIRQPLRSLPSLQPHLEPRCLPPLPVNPRLIVFHEGTEVAYMVQLHVLSRGATVAEGNELKQDVLHPCCSTLGIGRYYDCQRLRRRIGGNCRDRSGRGREVE